MHHWIETKQLDRELDDEAVRCKARPPVTKKIDPYRGIIQVRLEEFPRLSAKRLFDEVRAAGYAGGYTQLKEHVRSVRPVSPPALMAVVLSAPDDADAVPWARGGVRVLWRCAARASVRSDERGCDG